MAYEVHLDVFDGPFDLLLQLISAQEVDVYEVKLSVIVDAFCAEIARLEQFNLDIATEFLLIAATLVELKCRRLLPGLGDPDLDEELSLFEARDYLLARLVECKTFSGASAALAAAETQAARSVARRAGPDESFVGIAPDLLANVTPEDLLLLVRAALLERPRLTVSEHHVHEDEVTVAEMLDVFLGDLPQRGVISFRELTAPLATTAHIVASFLAVLELFKRELIDIEQFTNFGELRLRWVGTNGSIDASDIDTYEVMGSGHVR